MWETLPNEDDELQEDNDNDDKDNDDEKNDDDGNCPDEPTVTAVIEETMMKSVSEIKEDVESLSEKLITSQAVVKVQQMFKRIPDFESSISLFCAKEKTGRGMAKDLKSNYSPFVEVKIDNINFKQPMYVRKSTAVRLFQEGKRVSSDRLL